MRCSEARTRIGPDLPPREEVPEQSQALAHYVKCPACRAFYRTQHALKNRIANLARAFPIPEALRARVRAMFEPGR